MVRRFSDRKTNVEADPIRAIARIDRPSMYRRDIAANRQAYAVAADIGTVVDTIKSFKQIFQIAFFYRKIGRAHV